MSPSLERHLPLVGTYNVRDVGGYPTADGGYIRWETLLRSDALHRLDDQGRARLRELGLRTVVDLRDERERTQQPDALADIEANVVWQPLYDRTTASPVLSKSNWTLQDVYVDLLERLGDRLAAAVAALAEPGALPALVHCTAGKDRTGMVIALTLSAIGVADEDVCADFALSASFLTGAYLDEARERAAALGLGEEMLSIQYASEPEWMAHVLELVLERFGGADAYLLHHGLTRDQLNALRIGLVVHTSLEGSTS